MNRTKLRIALVIALVLLTGTVFTSAFSSQLSNAIEPLDIPTHDGSGQAVHPDVLYFGNGWDGWNGWNGYEYWMAMTPYPYGDSSLEYPNIIVSDDGVNWRVPTNLTNPIQSDSYDGHFADAELLYNEPTDELWCYYLWSDGIGEEMRIYLQTSKDGVNWFQPVKVLESEHKGIMSPAVLFVDNEYIMWVVNAISSPNIIERYESMDGLLWANKTVASFYGQLPINKEPWHINMELVEIEYRALLTVTTVNTTGAGTILLFANSTDGIEFIVADGLLLDIGTYGSWDDSSIYRSASVQIGDVWHIWYSAVNHDRVWGIGHTTMPSTTTTTTTTITTTTTTTDEPTDDDDQPIPDAILGGAVIGVVCIAVIVLALWRRR